MGNDLSKEVVKVGADEPIFTISDKTWVEGYWWCRMAGMSDMMALVYRPEGKDGKWIARIRFRYSHSHDPFDPKDEKSFYEISEEKNDAPLSDIMSDIDMIFRSTETVFGTTANIIRVDMSGPDFVDKILLKQEESHVATTGKGGSA